MVLNNVEQKCIPIFILWHDKNALQDGIWILTFTFDVRAFACLCWYEMQYLDSMKLLKGGNVITAVLVFTGDVTQAFPDT
jgi:hypothetical protein